MNYLTIIEEKHEALHKQSNKEASRESVVATIEGSVIGFKNLKEKYLTLREKSIEGKRWSQLLERSSKSTMDSYNFSETLGHHLERYKRREEER